VSFFSLDITMDTPVASTSRDWDTTSISVDEYITIDDNFIQSYEDAITDKLLTGPDDKSKFVLGTLFNSIARKIKESYCQILMYQERMDDNTITNHEKTCIETLTKKINHLGFKQPGDVLLLDDASPHDKDYKYIYTATLYCIATRDVNPVTCKTTDLFPIELMNHIHAIFDMPSTNQHSNLYRDLTYNAFALHIVKIATARWKETKVNGIFPTLSTCPLLNFDGVEINKYIGHNINSINNLGRYNRYNLFYRLLKPEAYENQTKAHGAISDIIKNYIQSEQQWKVIHEYYRQERIHAIALQIKPTIQTYLKALSDFKSNNNLSSFTSPFKLMSPQIIETLLQSNTDDIINNRQLLKAIADSLHQFQREIDPRHFIENGLSQIYDDTTTSNNGEEKSEEKPPKKPRSDDPALPSE
jgi:hypothetical protein